MFVCGWAACMGHAINWGLMGVWLGWVGGGDSTVFGAVVLATRIGTFRISSSHHCEQ